MEPRGLPIVSPYSARVFGVIAASHAAKSRGSHKVTFNESFCSVCLNWVTVPPYRWEEATISSPGESSVISVMNCAAMPLATTSAPVAPSNDASLSSSTAVVGLLMRV